MARPVKSKQAGYKKVKDHIDFNEVVSKFSIGITSREIAEWLATKYSDIGDKQFLLTEKQLQEFKDVYLDFYSEMQQDLAKTKTALASTDPNAPDEIELAVKKAPAYKEALLKLATGELDIEKLLANLVVNIETRLAQIFDQIQNDPNNINTKVDRLLVEYAETFGNLLDKYYKQKEGVQAQVVQHNVTLQVVDQHITVFHDVIKELLSQLDLESSLLFMELFNQKMAKLKMPEVPTQPTQEMRLAEAKLLGETINQKLNQTS